MSTKTKDQTELLAPKWTPLQKRFRAARQIGTPLTYITTSDPAATIKSLIAASVYNVTDPSGKKVETYAPCVTWNISSGMSASNEAGLLALAQMILSPDKIETLSAMTATARQAEILKAGRMVTNPGQFLTSCLNAPERTIIFMSNMQRYFLGETSGPTSVIQGIWNLRDEFKQNFRTFVGLCPALTVPPELSDLIGFDDPLPNEMQLESIVRKTLDDANVSNITSDMLKTAVRATMGLSPFVAEQVVSMSLYPKDGKTHLDLDSCWERKITMIEQTPGLKVHRGNETLNDVRGSANVANYLKRYFETNGPSLVVWLDEIEKMLGGADGDTTGTSKEILGKLLTTMQDEEWDGVLFIGPPGSGKSLMAKIAGGLGSVPTVQCNLGDTKGKFVGETNERLSQLIKMIGGMAGGKGRVLCIGTCNSVDGLAPEFLARFGATFFFDLPNAEERASIWDLYITKFGLDAEQDMPKDNGWAARDIARCATNAKKMRFPLLEAAKYVVSVTSSSGDRITNLRMSANGRYTSANHPGPYVYNAELTTPSTVLDGKRKMDLLN